MKKLMGLSLLLTAVIACNTADDITLQAGETFTNTNVRVLQIDTFDLEFSTFKFDSIQMPVGDRILIGDYTDSYFGKTNSQSYMEMIPDSYDIDNEGVFDSIVLIMSYDHYYYNDTLNQNTFKVHEVTERIKPPHNESYFYNTSELSYNENEPLGTYTFLPRPMSGDSIRITLNNAFGNYLFGKIQNNDITNIDELRANFKGISVLAEDNANGAVLGFSIAAEETMIRMYYSVPEDVASTEQIYDFTINTTSTPATYFNHIEANRSATVLENITNDQRNLVSSTLLNNATYIQSGVGIASRIRIPHLKSLYEIDGNGAVLEANLKIYINPQSYSKQLYLNDSLTVNTLDRHMNISEEVTNYTEESTIATLAGNSEFNEIYYSIPLTTYVDVVLASDSEEDLYLTLIPDAYESTVNRTILNDAKVANYKAILELTYAIYNEED